MSHFFALLTSNRPSFFPNLTYIDNFRILFIFILHPFSSTHISVSSPSSSSSFCTLTSFPLLHLSSLSLALPSTPSLHSTPAVLAYNSASPPAAVTFHFHRQYGEHAGSLHRHLRYVLGDRRPAGRSDWRGEGEIELAVFAAPYRAEAFVQTLQSAAPGLRLEWFRQDVARFRVVMLYADGGEYDRARSELAAAGFPIG